MTFDENKGLIKEEGDLEWTPIFKDTNTFINNLSLKQNENKQTRMEVCKPLSKSNFGGR